MSIYEHNITSMLLEGVVADGVKSLNSLEYIQKEAEINMLLNEKIIIAALAKLDKEKSLTSNYNNFDDIDNINDIDNKNNYNDDKYDKNIFRKQNHNKDVIMMKAMKYCQNQINTENRIVVVSNDDSSNNHSDNNNNDSDNDHFDIDTTKNNPLNTHSIRGNKGNLTISTSTKSRISSQSQHNKSTTNYILDDNLDFMLPSLPKSKLQCDLSWKEEILNDSDMSYVKNRSNLCIK